MTENQQTEKGMITEALPEGRNNLWSDRRGGNQEGFTQLVGFARHCVTKNEFHAQK
jgi:hypothetical protein